jgi:hypothetical protein
LQQHVRRLTRFRITTSCPVEATALDYRVQVEGGYSADHHQLPRDPRAGRQRWSALRRRLLQVTSELASLAEGPCGANISMDFAPALTIKGGVLTGLSTIDIHHAFELEGGAISGTGVVNALTAGDFSTSATRTERFQEPRPDFLRRFRHVRARRLRLLSSRMKPTGSSPTFPTLSPRRLSSKGL